MKRTPTPARKAPARTAPAAPAAFVPLTSLAKKAATPDELLGEIRRIYFKTSSTTIDADLQHAIALLRLLPDEDARERATVYMEGLNDLRKEFAGKPARGKKAR